MNQGRATKSRKKFKKTWDNSLSWQIWAWEGKKESWVFISLDKEEFFLGADGFGPVKSTEMRTKGCMARMRLIAGGIWNVGFSSKQTTHWMQTFFRSKENGKFFILTKWSSLVISEWHSDACISSRETESPLAAREHTHDECHRDHLLS